MLKIEKYIISVLSKKPEKTKYTRKDFSRYSEFQIHMALLSLEEKEYINYSYHDLELIDFEIQSKVNCIFYKEKVFREFIRNIFIPFVVSVITTIVTSFLIG